jgi:hypothetical protein
VYATHTREEVKMKKEYTQPQLVKHGTVSEITLTPPSGKDTTVCPIDKFDYFSCGAHS